MMEYNTNDGCISAPRMAEISDGNDILACTCKTCSDCFAPDSGLYRECPGCGAPIRDVGISRCSCGTVIWVCGSANAHIRVVTVYSIGIATPLIATREETI